MPDSPLTRAKLLSGAAIGAAGFLASRALGAEAGHGWGTTHKLSRTTSTIATPQDTTSYLDDVGLIFYAPGNPATLTHLDDYGTILFGQDSHTSTFAPKAGRCLKYFWLHSAIGSNSLNITSAAAAAGGYRLKDSAGVIVDHSGQGPYCDLGNASYQADVLTVIQNYLSTNPTVDGIFVDNFDTDWPAYAGGMSAAFPTYQEDGTTVVWNNNTDYENDVLAFAQAVLKPIKDSGKLVVMNAGVTFFNTTDRGLFQGLSFPAAFNGSTATLDWANRYKSYATGMCVEHWLQNQASPYTVGLNNHVTSKDYWDEWTSSFLPTLQGTYGLDFYPVCVVSSANAAVARYMRATFLMQWDGGGGSFLFGIDGSYAADPWTAELAVDVGQPQSAVVAVGSGWKRQYEKKLVYINPTASTQVLDGNSIASGDALFV